MDVNSSVKLLIRKEVANMRCPTALPRQKWSVFSYLGSKTRGRKERRVRSPSQASSRSGSVFTRLGAKRQEQRKRDVRELIRSYVTYSSERQRENEREYHRHEWETYFGRRNKEPSERVKTDSWGKGLGKYVPVKKASRMAHNYLSEPYNKESTTPFTPRINDFIFQKEFGCLLGVTSKAISKKGVSPSNCLSYRILRRNLLARREIPISRSGIHALGVVLSTAHGMMKFPTMARVATIMSERARPLSIQMVHKLITPPPRTESVKVVIKPDYAEQSAMLGGEITDEGQRSMCEVLKANLDVEYLLKGYRYKQRCEASPPDKGDW
ncbi:hypothetical protein Tco_0687647 [Tanacetum coccineum]